MNDINAILLFAAIGCPLLCAVFLFAGKSLGNSLVKGIAFVGFLAPAVISFWLWTQYAPEIPGGYDFISKTSTGLQSFGIVLHLGLNGVSLPLFILAGVVGLAAGFYAMNSKAERLSQYLLLLLVMQAGLMGVFASVDVFFFYFFHELALIPTFIMIGVWGGRDRHFAAMKVTIYLTLGAMLSLAGLIVLYVKSGATSFDLLTLREILAAQPLSEIAQRNVFALLLFGFGILVSLWPFHTWAPLGYGAAPSSAAMLHAGVLKKFGLYGLIQIGLPLLPSGGKELAPLLAWLALGNVVIIGLITLVQRDLKQMLGYSSVMHMGYCFLGVACVSLIGSSGVVILMVAHGLTVALLFMLATCIYHRSQTFDMLEIGGLVKKTPVLAAFFSFAILASIGTPGPGLANFWGEFTIFLAVWDFRSWMVVPAVLGVILSAVYGLRAIGRIFFGGPTESFRERLDSDIQDMSWNERIPALLLIVVLLIVGIWPRLVSDNVNAALQPEFTQIEQVVSLSEQSSEE